MTPIPLPAGEGMHRHLIVTADDFGADTAVNDAVAQAHRGGILTAASLMVGAPAAAAAVQIANTLPALGVGLHLVLVDGVPVLPAREVPRLVDAHGRFRDDMVRAGIAFAVDHATRKQLRAEIEAQFAAFAATGLALDHVNAHKHFHVHPVIAGLILDIGKRYGLRALRAPVEPANIIRATGEPASFNVATPWARRVARRFRRAGMTVPDRVFGLRWSGHVTAQRLAALLAVLPPGLNEIYLHPATRDDYPGHGPGYAHREELMALTAHQTRAALAARDIRTGRFADFGAA